MRNLRAFLTLLLPMLPLAAAEPVPAGWEAVAAAGQVQSRAEAADNWDAVHRGDVLAAERVVRTGRRGRTTLIHGANVILVDPGSEVILPATGGNGSEVMQTKGSVLYEVEHRDRPHFKVVTPYLVAGVKGTSFLVSVHDKYTSVRVDKGLVEVFDPATGEKTDLAPGESVIRMHDAMRLEHASDKRQADRHPDKHVRRAYRDTQERLDRAVDRRRAHDGWLVVDGDRQNPDRTPADVGAFAADDDSGVAAGLDWSSGLDEDNDEDGSGLAGELVDDEDFEEEWEEDLVDDDVRKGTRPDDDFTDGVVGGDGTGSNNPN